MKHAVNAPEGSNALAQLSALPGVESVVQPNPAIMYFEVTGPESLHDAIAALGFSCCCAESTNISLPAIQAVDGNNWHLGSISGLPLSEYEYDADGTGVPTYLVDQPVAVQHFAGQVTQIYDPAGVQLAVSHGTNMAGFICHPTHGVAKGAHVYALAGFDGAGNTSISSLNAALSEALNHKNANHPNTPAVCNCSFVAWGFQLSDPFSAAVNALKSAGFEIVAAAGNDSVNLDDGTHYWPAENPNVITVGAHDVNGNLAIFSNTGSTIEILAPGVDCQTIDHVGNTAIVSGTSGAAAVTTGAVACLLSAGVAPLPYIQANAVNGNLYKAPVVIPAPPPPSTGLNRCLLIVPSNITGANFSTPSPVPFGIGSEVKNGGGWRDPNVSNTRIIIPESVDAVQINCTVHIFSAANGSRFLVYLTKNGAFQLGYPSEEIAIGPSGEGRISLCSSHEDVAPGNYLEVFLYCSDPSIGIVGGVTNFNVASV